MKSIYTFLSCIILLVCGSATVGYSQPGGGCSGRFTITYPNGSGNTAPISINNGTGNITSNYCPDGSGSANVTIISESPGIFYFTLASDTTKRLASHYFTSAEISANTPYTYTLNTTVNTVYSLISRITCNNQKNSNITFTLAPSLTLTSNQFNNPATVCPGTPVILTARGALAGSDYILLADGVEVDRNRTGDFTVYPAVSTNYTVKTTTASCANDSAIQGILVTKQNLAITSNPADTGINGGITSGQSVTLTASNGVTSSYKWTVDGAAIPSADGQATITVKPTRSVTYYVSGNTTIGNCPTTASIAVYVNGKPLPVELSGFEAVRNDKGAVLTWTTASEKNSAYFEIERSFDGKNFESVGQRAGAGTTSARTNYQFVDTRLAQSSGTVYYRLRQVDVTGEANYSPVRALQSPATARAIKAEVFPNPFDKTVAVQYYSLGTDAVTLTVRNVLGQTVLTQTASTAEGVQEIKLSEAPSLSRGMYYLTIRQGGQQQVVRISRQ